MRTSKSSNDNASDLKESLFFGLSIAGNFTSGHHVNTERWIGIGQAVERELGNFDTNNIDFLFWRNRRVATEHDLEAKSHKNDTTW